jgi:hypothetical protein
VMDFDRKTIVAVAVAVVPVPVMISPCCLLYCPQVLSLTTWLLSLVTFFDTRSDHRS